MQNIFTCKEYRMMKRYTGTRMIKGETGDGQNDEQNGGDRKDQRTVESKYKNKRNLNDSKRI